MVEKSAESNKPIAENHHHYFLTFSNDLSRSHTAPKKKTHTVAAAADVIAEFVETANAIFVIASGRMQFAKKVLDFNR